MEVVGRIIVALPEVTGTSKAGNPWKKREYVLETQENFPRKIHFDFFGDRADQYPLQVGQEIKLSFDIESREFRGNDGTVRWFTSIRGWKAEPATAAAPAAPAYGAPAPGAVPPPPAYGAPAAAPAAFPGAVPPPPAMPQSGPSDDLPF